MVVPGRILLVCPPFQSCALSSLGTAHLATYLRGQGVDCVEAYPHIALATTLGLVRYDAAGRDRRSTGELLFAEGLHEPPPEDARDQALADFGNRDERAALRRDFVRDCLDEILASDAEYVGFTTSFNQLMASLLLARALKRLAPDRKTILGGAACLEPMGRRILDSYPHIDYVVSGAGETPLLRIGRGDPPSERYVRSHEFVDLEAMPVPDYGPFLAAVTRAGWPHRVSLTFETSRGCWWGQKRHCKFCGINGSGLCFHAKSPQRAVAEIRSLWEKHGLNLVATDAILPRQYLGSVVQELGQYDRGPNVLYELKSLVTEQQVIALARARMHAQPGIESLSTRLLRLLDKGGSAIRNLALLKWCGERGVALGWNLLYAIPGETVGDYEEQLDLMPRIAHFPPPTGAYQVRIARYSPYFERYRDYGWSALRPCPEYRSWHPQLDDAALLDLVPFFVGEGGPDTAPYETRLREAVARWIANHQRGDGLFLDPVRGLVRNEGGSGFKFDPHPVLDAVIAATHQVATVESVLRKTRCRREFLQQMQRLGLVYIEQDRIINLAVRTDLRASRGDG
jgi:ribosomal peptide maturation radical SAM protein 1